MQRVSITRRTNYSTSSMKKALTSAVYKKHTCKRGNPLRSEAIRCFEVIEKDARKEGL